MSREVLVATVGLFQSGDCLQCELLMLSYQCRIAAVISLPIIWLIEKIGKIRKSEVDVAELVFYIAYVTDVGVFWICQSLCDRLSAICPELCQPKLINIKERAKIQAWALTFKPALLHPFFHRSCFSFSVSFGFGFDISRCAIRAIPQESNLIVQEEMVIVTVEYQESSRFAEVWNSVDTRGQGRYCKGTLRDL